MSKNPFKIIARFLASIPVYLYRFLIKPWLPKSCAFVPTCSEYALIAIRERGVFVGWWLATRRILRCNPFNKNAYGVDPVPHKKECKCSICLALCNSQMDQVGSLESEERSLVSSNGCTTE